MNLRRVLAPLIATVVLSGCASSPRLPESEHERFPEPAPGAAAPAPSRAEVEPASASAALVSQARVALAEGDAVRAADAVERALRIEPSNPFLWLELAKIRRVAGDSAQALALGQKALRLAGGDAAARTAATRFIDQL